MRHLAMLSTTALLSLAAALPMQDGGAAAPAPKPGPGQLVEGQSVNPYTYEPKANPGDPNDPAQADLHRSLEAMGPVAVEWYQHVQTLSNPFF